MIHMRDEKNVLLIDSLNNTTYLFQVKYQLKAFLHMDWRQIFNIIIIMLKKMSRLRSKYHFEQMMSQILSTNIWLICLCI